MLSVSLVTGYTSSSSYFIMKRVRVTENSAGGAHKKRASQGPLLRLNTDLQSIILRHCDASSFGRLEQALTAHILKVRTRDIVALRCAPPSRRLQGPFQPSSRWPGIE